MRGIEAVLTVEGNILAKRRYRMKVFLEIKWRLL